jgi:catechol 2,3-dioxygenase-like lactoylglutathione lyase family enzyme
MLTDAGIHATIATKDLARASGWYHDKLGWEAIRDLPGVLVYEVDGGVHVLYETQFAGTAQNTVAGLVVSDLRAEVARLRARGVVFEDLDLGDTKTVDGIADMDDGALNAWFRDSDGNWIALGELDLEREDRFWREHGYTDPTPPPASGLRPILAASDLVRARSWYEQRLGLTPYRELADEILFYREGETRFSIYPTPSAGTAQNTVAAWWVDDLPAEVAALRSRGVQFEDYDFTEGRTVDGILESEDGLTAWFKDSEGNILSLGQYAALKDLGTGSTSASVPA